MPTSAGPLIEDELKGGQLKQFAHVFCRPKEGLV